LSATDRHHPGSPVRPQINIKFLDVNAFQTFDLAVFAINKGVSVFPVIKSFIKTVNLSLQILPPEHISPCTQRILLGHTQRIIPFYHNLPCPFSHNRPLLKAIWQNNLLVSLQKLPDSTDIIKYDLTSLSETL